MREVTVLSFGAGVQSSTIYLMAQEGSIPAPDHVIFADTGWEPREVYAWIDYLDSLRGIPIHRVSNGNIKDDASKRHGRKASMPLYVDANGSAMLRRQCTNEYKIRPINRRIRECIGVEPGNRVKGVHVRLWLGLTIDEIYRVKPDKAPWITREYPLIDRRMTRGDCQTWLQDRGLVAPKSSCLGCPFHSDHWWKRLKRKSPEEWDEVVQFEKLLQEQGLPRVNCKPYLHRSLKPLDQVDLQDDQLELFGEECEGVCGV